MDARVTISADETDTPNRDGSVTALDLSGVHVSLAGEARCNGDEHAGAEWRCTECSEPLTRSTHPNGSESYFDTNGEETCYQASRVDGPADHDPELVPLSWANSAWIDCNEKEDRITVAISVGDPRGAFVLQVERMRWTDAETGEEHDELRLSVPSPDDAFAHAPLTALASPGYYRIGGEA
jgi:hypothetical protein